MLLIISAITAYATALLLDVHTGLAIVAVSAVASIIGLSCLRVPWDRWDGRLLLAVPLIALVQVALDVALVDFVLTCLFVPVALYIALVFPSPRIALPFLALMMVTLLLPFV